jgi:two-component system, OmpR family, response regulator VicR
MNPMKKKILVVEDDVHIQTALKAFLESKGYEVSVASDGYAGIDALLREEPDLLLLDINMPRLDGLNALGLMRFTERKVPPVIIVSSLGDRENVLKAVGFAADDFVRKPFDLHDLGRRVEQQLLTLDFHTLHEILEKLTIADLTRPEKFSRFKIPDWIPYSSHYRGLKVCVLMNPEAGAKHPLSLTYEQCLTELVVLADYKSGWRSIWPKQIPEFMKPEKKQSVG